MSSERRSGLLEPLFAACSSALLLACADFSRGAPLPAGSGPPPAASDAAAGSSFGAQVHSLLLEGCQSCHAGGGAAASTELVYVGDASADYDTTLPFVTPDSPEASRLVTKLQGRGHGGGGIFASTSPEYAVILTWIREGAAP